MFKFLLRKRFVCGYGIKHSDYEGNFLYRSIKWITSFKTKEEAYKWCAYIKIRPALYDRKTKIQSRGTDITQYTNNLEE